MVVILKQTITARKIGRKLTDAFEAQVDAGAIISLEEAAFCNTPILSYLPDRTDIENLQEWLYFEVLEFQRLSRLLKLPTHNAVAFFEALIQLEKELCIEQTRCAKLKLLLLWAISGRGYLFGTAFDWEHSLAVRPCDFGLFQLTDKESDEYWRLALENQLALKDGAYFREDYLYCETIIRDIERQNELVSEWMKMDRAQQGTKVKLTEQDILSFFEIYKDYCTEQAPKSGNEKSVCSVSKQKELERDLQYIEETIHLLIDLEHLCHRLEEILTIPEDDVRLEKKNQWLDDLNDFLHNKTGKAKLEHAVEIAQRDGKSKEAMPAMLGLHDFFTASKTDSLSWRKTYPILDRSKAIRSLNENERNALHGYQKHPFYQCFQQIQKELSRKWVAQAGPYYLVHWFINKLQPKIPFLKRSYRFTDKHIQLTDKITLEADWRQTFFQQCHLNFFHKLCQWYYEICCTNETLECCNERLCMALYARCRHQVVKLDWLPFESRRVHVNCDSERPIFRLFNQLDGLFEYSQFPVYAKTMCRPEDMFYFFYEKEDQSICNVKRRIRKQLKHENLALFQSYKQIAFLSEYGIGHGIMPKEWHMQMANWLETVIKSDPMIESYAAGESDPYYLGSGISLSSLNGAIDTSKADIIHPEDLQPNLAVVEWYIQKVCSKMIAADLCPRVLSLCKRVFFEK